MSQGLPRQLRQLMRGDVDHAARAIAARMQSELKAQEAPFDLTMALTSALDRVPPPLDRAGLCRALLSTLQGIGGALRRAVVRHVPSADLTAFLERNPGDRELGGACWTLALERKDSSLMRVCVGHPGAPEIRHQVDQVVGAILFDSDMSRMYSGFMLSSKLDPHALLDGYLSHQHPDTFHSMILPEVQDLLESAIEHCPSQLKELVARVEERELPIPLAVRLELARAAVAPVLAFEMP